jgi:hypothetical protein
MARRTGFKIPGLRTWVDNIKNEVSQKAAEQIVLDLKEIGPYWTGTFEESWVVRLGDVRIGASTPARERTPFAQPRKVTPIRVAKPRGRKSVFFTIGNTAEYRNVALDLIPGRIKGGGNETAPQDWFRTYVEGGNLRLTLQQVTGRVAQDPKIRGFKGS